MTHFKLIVKGNAAKVSAALSAHGITEIHESRVTGHVEMLVYVESDFESLAGWFLETRDTPFPPGALLHYAEVQESRQ